ncbi:MAG: hypothetical protein KGL39_46215 [Patescibacteria group bacterium]|nr:hypothetical protein [Patescibacteria group bacterium]
MNSVAWRDALFGALIGITFLFIAVLASIVKKAQDAEQGIHAVGNLTVMIQWPITNMSDIDLWSMGPGEPKPVGYSDPQGVHFSLTHDDRPLQNIGEFAHVETAVWRGIWPGQYVENVHVYDGELLPVVVQMTVDCIPPSGKPRQLLKRTVTLTEDGSEITVLRFAIDKDCNVLPDSVDHLQQNLRS